MGRAGRYTLAVMAWVATYAVWSGLLGLVVAAVTGERLGVGDAVQSEVPVAVSALFFVLLPAPPTVVALWFNDWARDGFPSKAERAARREVADVAGVAVEVEPPVEPPAAAPEAPAVAAPPEPVATGRPRVVAPPPLGVPVRDVPAAESGFPVAPLLRD